MTSIPAPPDLGARPRAMPIGAEAQPGGGVDVRIWAPKPQRIVLVMDGREVAMTDEPGGYRAAFVPLGGAGSRYGFHVDGGDRLYPDPASRFQPDGPHGLSAVVDPSTYRWRDTGWRGLSRKGQVILEMHVGTFTPEGTWRAAIDKLPLLAEVGITVIEVMPVSDFPGRFGWGYDGVNLFAPSRLYGEPDDLRAFVDAAHGLGLGVIHDVVYNHIGPDGNYLPIFSGSWFTHRYENDWGDAINYDDAGADGVREFVRENAAYWIREFHFDGLRLDATQQIFDASPHNIMAELTAAARAAAGARGVLITAESERQETRLVRPETADGYGLDAIWSEDSHHAARVALTGFREGYYSDYAGSARELAACAKHGFLYQGQRSAWQNSARGSPARDIAPEQRIHFLENHDQVANSATGGRLATLTDPRSLRAMTALFLLMPGTPLLFQGQEWCSTTPFLYFADHNPELAEAVRKGRREFLMQFPSIAGVATDDPESEVTFRRCLLDWAERARNAWAVRLHRDLIALRRDDSVLAEPESIDAATLSERALVVRWTGAREERLGLFNFGADLVPRIVPEPLLAPPGGGPWRMIWSSEDAAYAGAGARAPVDEAGIWHLQGRTAALLAAPR